MPILPCPLCTARDGAGEATLLALAPSAVVAAKISQVLAHREIPFLRNTTLFLLEPRSRDEEQEIAGALHNALTESDRHDVRIAAGTLASIFGAETLDVFLQRRQTEWFDQAWQDDRFTFYFQPIVDVLSRCVVAHEALIRLELERVYNGAEIMGAALLRQSIHSFDAYARLKALRCADLQHRSGTRLFVNFLPSTIYDPDAWLEAVSATLARTSLQPCDVVFEVVESEKNIDVTRLRRMRQLFRTHGFGCALDDVGAGTNSIDLVYEMQPDFIKLDKSLVWGLDSPVKSDTVRKLVDLAGEFSAVVIAEGVEDAGMAGRVGSFGVRLMQGYFFGRPSPDMHAVADNLLELIGAVTDPVAQAKPHLV